MERYKKRFPTTKSEKEPPLYACPNVPDAYGERTSPELECTALRIKHLALFYDTAAALSFCSATSNLFGTQHTYLTALRIDPIFFGAMTDNPWQFLYSNVQNWIKPPELLAVLFACGWNRKTTPERFQKHISRRSKYAKLMICTPEQELMPWKIPGAKKLVQDHYFYDGQPGIPTSYFGGMLGEGNINMFVRYTLLMEKYGLLSTAKINFMRRHIRAVVADIKRYRNKPVDPIEYMDEDDDV